MWLSSQQRPRTPSSTRSGRCRNALAQDEVAQLSDRLPQSQTFRNDFDRHNSGLKSSALSQIDESSRFSEVSYAESGPPEASFRDSSMEGSPSSSVDNDNISVSTVLKRIEDLMIEAVIDPLDKGELPHIGQRSFCHSMHCRSLTSIFMVASFCYELLHSHRTTTTREVYYFFVTHFRNQAECDKAIWDLSALVRVPRSALGLAASPKGWFCGCLNLYNARGELIVNGRELDSHGMAITTSTHKYTTITSDAKCILAIEKEGVYNRLSEDKFFLKYYPCILVTGKGFPDVATRQWVQQLQRVLGLPVYGLCDCNPYGISVLNTYHYDQVTSNQRGPRDLSRLQLQWIGLRPSQLEALNLPASVFQQLTPQDEKRLSSLQQETHPFHQHGWNPQKRMEELQQMERKVELEALNWKGMDYLCQWLYNILMRQDEADAEGAEEAEYII